jgi:hypothetical protein
MPFSESDTFVMKAASFELIAMEFPSEDNSKLTLAERPPHPPSETTRRYVPALVLPTQNGLTVYNCLPNSGRC